MNCSQAVTSLIVIRQIRQQWFQCPGRSVQIQSHDLGFTKLNMNPAGFLGFLKDRLDGPPAALPGDSLMPRVQSVGFGASERFVVSPGREEAGLFHMPGGQSGHPFSPYYLAGHEAWARGLPTPFLPGPVKHTLTLVAE